MPAVGTFAIELLEARWLTEPETDLCAHGTVRVQLGTEAVTVDDLNVAFGSRSALRTLDADRRADANDPLFPHACNLFWGCPVVAIDWSIGHEGHDVHLGDLMARPADRVTKPEANASNLVVSLDAYRDTVVEFARAVRRFYGPSERKVIAEEWERPLFEDFWADFDALFTRHDRST